LLADLLTGKVPHERIVDHALTVLGVTQRSGSCYGFQVADGVVLPAVLNGNDERALLELYPAWIAHAPSGARLFRYALQDYYAAPRQALDAGSSKPPASAHGEAGRIRIESDDPDDTRLSLELVVDGHHCAVDLGQVLRGARFLYSAPQTPGHDPRAEQPVQWHSPAALLASSTPITPALVTADSGVHALAGDELTALALLGRIYPENIVLGRGEPLGTLRTAGKGFGPIFMIGDLSTALHSVELRTLA